MVSALPLVGIPLRRLLQSSFYRLSCAASHHIEGRGLSNPLVFSPKVTENINPRIPRRLLPHKTIDHRRAVQNHSGLKFSRQDILFITIHRLLQVREDCHSFLLQNLRLYNLLFAKSMFKSCFLFTPDIKSASL